MKAKRTRSSPKLPPEYHVSSKQRNSKKFFEQIKPRIMKDLGLKEKKFLCFRKGLFCIMWSRKLWRSHNCNQKFMLLWGSRIKYGIFILPKDIWIHVWLPKWCKGRGYYISIGLWLFSVQRGY